MEEKKTEIYWLPTMCQVFCLAYKLCTTLWECFLLKWQNLELLPKSLCYLLCFPNSTDTNWPLLRNSGTRIGKRQWWEKSDVVEGRGKSDASMLTHELLFSSSSSSISSSPSPSLPLSPVLPSPILTPTNPLFLPHPLFVLIHISEKTDPENFTRLSKFI